MKISTKFLLTSLGLGLLYSVYRLFTGQGGSGLGDFLDALAITSFVLSAASLLILLFNVRHLKKHIDTFVFLLLGLPLTIAIVKNVSENIKYNRTPDLSPKYTRPVDNAQYLGDSTHIQIAIDSLIAMRNRHTRGTKVKYAFIDTIIYSPKGDQVFISYVKKYEPNNLGNDLDTWFLSGNERNNIYWNLSEGKSGIPTLSGSFHNLESLKKEVRKFYFNQFSFNPKDSLKENYFWK